MRAEPVLLNDRAAYDAARAAAAPRSRPRLGCIDADPKERLIMFQLFLHTLIHVITFGLFEIQMSS